jgi:glycosyltransferase involved in cell wall biosynthesis
VALRAVDASLAAAAAFAGACRLLARRARRGAARPDPAHPRLMAIDSMYSLNVLRAREALHLVTYRDLDGYFEHVWTVHPFVGLDPTKPEPARVGRPAVTPINAAHTMVEGCSARLPRLARLPHLNFVLAQLALLLELDRVVQRHHVAIVRGDPYYHGLLALLLGRLNGCSVELRVIANHDALYHATGTLAYPRLFRWRAVERAVVRFTLARADSVVVASADNREFALRNGARPERVAFAANGSMVSPIHLEEPLGRAAVEDEFALGDRPVVVCVGRLASEKHPEDVVIAAAKARDRVPDIVVLFVGEGPVRSELGRLSTELGVDAVFAGDRDQRWLARMLPRCTIVAAPLAGLALVESALSATPIVAYDVEWHSELIRSGEDGILVAYRDTDAMAAAIADLAEDRALAKRLGAAGRARALDVMDPAKLIAQERALAAGLLAGAAAAPPPS